tara:strand:+ start:175 stop:1695 length:1521 start_codon:yes stop_codon:yes gene_type:complete
VRRIKSNSILLLLFLVANYNAVFSQDNSITKSDSLSKAVKSDCTCYEFAEKKTRYYSPLDLLIPYDQFVKQTGWYFKGGESSYKKTYMKQMISNPSRSMSTYSLILVSFEPLLLINSNKSLSINFTPCTNENDIFELPIHIGYENSIQYKLPNFEPYSFDRSSKAYLDLLLELSNSENSVEAILNHQFYYTEEEIDSYVARINKKYATSIELEENNPEDNVQLIVSELKRKGIGLTDFLMQEYVLDESGVPKNDFNEVNRVLQLFSESMGRITVESVDRTIYAQSSAVITNKTIAVEIDTSILRQWNSALEKTHKQHPIRILIDVANFKYHSFDGLEIDNTTLCHSPAEISGTGIQLHFDQGELINSKRSRQSLIHEYNYPLFITDSSIIRNQINKNEVAYSYQYDSSISAFDGLYIPKCILEVPFDQEVISFTAKELIVNNYLISGSIEINLAIDNPFSLILQQFPSYLERSIRQLSGNLEKNGLEVKVVKGADLFTIYFRKVLN